MKLKTLLTLALSAVFAVGTAVADDTPLGKSMSAINKNLRTLKRQIADPAKKEANLELVKKINETVVEACKHEPAKTKDQADKAAYLAKYKEQMDALGKSFSELETAIKEDKQDDAKKILAKLSDQKEKGHKDFGVDDE